jgi:PBP1b-binding outer membrane lipoprotein LpoB
MNTKTIIPVLLAAALFVGCASGEKDEAAYRSASDTTSSEMASPSSDTLIKDTAMKDSTATGTATGTEKPAKRGPLMP